MFKRRRPPYPDFSTRLRDELRLWNTTPQAFQIEPLVGPCTVCVDASAQLFAMGTSQGQIRVYDQQFKETILVTPKNLGVKLLQFARPRDLFQLLCIDSKYNLLVWDLDVHGDPDLQACQPLYGPIYRISTCLGHSHALLATRSGDILTYNLSTLHLSPYKIPYALDDKRNLPVADVALIPHKLNHILVGYEGGTVLYDLVLRKVIKTYTQESMLALKNNHSSLTTLALHPIGQHCAAGYEDGTICVWDLHSSKALWVGTIDRQATIDAGRINQEPIFKMEWLIYEGNNGFSTSWLSVLGGLHQSGDEIGGISALCFDTAQLRDAAVESPITYIYPSVGPVQDFAVLPTAATSTALHGRLFILSEDGNQTTSLDAFEFPPQSDSSHAEQLSDEDRAVRLEFSAELEESEERSRALAATLCDLQSDAQEQESRLNSHTTLRRVPLPVPLYVGSTAILEAEIVSLKKTEYLRLVRQPNEGETSVSTHNQYRILITQHEDNSIRFHDVSMMAGINLTLHPLPLDHLTIRVLELPEIALRPDIHSLYIVSVIMAREALECAVQLSTGEVVVLGLGVQSRTQDVLDEELLDLSDVRDRRDVFAPRFILQAQEGGTGVICLSDIGFLAVAFRHGLLLIVDLRGPKVILRDMPDTTSKHEIISIESLSWIVSSLGDDNILAPRLLVQRHDGTLMTYTLTLSEGTWAVDKTRTTRQEHHSPNTLILSTVIDAQTGVDSRATPSRLADAMVPLARRTKSDFNAPHCFWVAATRREIRIYLNITGDKVSKLSVSAQDALNHISLVNAHDCSVLVALSHGRAIIHSLPLLEVIHTFQLPVAPEISTSICCTPTGDLLQIRRSRGIGTILVFTSLLAHSRSSASGSVNFRLHKYVRPTLPDAFNLDLQSDAAQTWGSGIANWIKGLTGETVVTGDEIDLLLASSEVVEAPEKPKPLGLMGSSDTNKKSESGPRGNWGHDMYQQLTSAAAERGERLGELQEHFQQLQAGSKDMVSQAKKLAERQAAKRWFL